MRSMMQTAACLAAIGAGCGAAAQYSEAVYVLEVDTHWTAATHGSGYISTAHFSPLVGMVHNDQASMWEPGELASFAIERMAESGSSAELQEEANQYVDAGTARVRLVGPGMRDDDLYSRNIRLSTIHPLFTMVTMVAPSPDWFMGTHGVSLLDANGDWIEELVIPLEVYDSGTEEGTTFSTGNPPSMPHVPIRNIQNEIPFNGVPPIATYTLTLLFVEVCLPDVNGDGVLSPADFNAWILAFNNQSPGCDQNGDGACTPADFNSWIQNFSAGC